MKPQHEYRVALAIRSEAQLADVATCLSEAIEASSSLITEFRILSVEKTDFNLFEEPR